MYLNLWKIIDVSKIWEKAAMYYRALTDRPSCYLILRFSFPMVIKILNNFNERLFFLRLVFCYFGNPTAKRQKSATEAGTIPCCRQPHLSVSYTYKVRLRNLTYFRQIDVPPHWVFCRISSKFARLFGILMQFVTKTPPSKWLIFKKFFMIAKNCPL